MGDSSKRIVPASSKNFYCMKLLRSPILISSTSYCIPSFTFSQFLVDNTCMKQGQKRHQWMPKLFYLKLAFWPATNALSYSAMPTSNFGAFSAREVFEKFI